MNPKTVQRRLTRLARDLRWTWSPLAQRLFAALDPRLWEATRHAPLEQLARIAPARLAARAQDDAFLDLLGRVEAERKDYLASESWFAKRHAQAAGRRGLRVAYLCSEYAVHESLPQYSGGLGVLAGDHMKSCSDLGVPLVGVGLLYRHGFYEQELDDMGKTRVLYHEIERELLPIEDTGVEIACPVGARVVRARVWRQQVGRVPIYLLDTDLPAASKPARELTEGLYKGGPDLRLRQQVLLGVGGVLALQAVGEKVNVYHLNEGHAAFANVERLRQLVLAGMTWEDALERVAMTSVFTTHTPVPAGHDRYEPAAVARALRPLLKDLGLSTQALADLGREEPGNKAERLCMTVLALRTADHVNGVSRLHGEVSREMWRGVYDEQSAEEVPIDSITNGVHLRTWLAPEAAQLFAKRLRAPAYDSSPDEAIWKRIERLGDEDLWDLRGILRRRLVHFVRTRLAQQAMRRGEDALQVAEARGCLDENVLTIGFARRFATYKRAPLVFSQLKRLRAILGDTKRPMQLVFAGKAHPRDEGGQAYAARIHKLAKQSGLRGRVALIEEYDMQVGRMLTSGCDVWLNTPLRPHEASGTSGMKPPLHGGLNLSILDGWWPESHDGSHGWAIDADAMGVRGKSRDARDAEALYQLLEKQVAALFYRRDKAGLPRGWLKMARASLASVPCQFNSHRMVAQYVEQSYLPAWSLGRGH